MQFQKSIRVPDSIETTQAAPCIATAGEPGTWTLPFLLCKDVEPGTIMKLQIGGKRNNRGGFTNLQSGDPAGEGFISASLENGGSLELKPEKEGELYFLSVPEQGLRKGRKIIVTLGDQTHGSNKGAMPDTERILNKFFVLYTLPGSDEKSWPPGLAAGSAWTEETSGYMVAVCLMHILGGPVSRIRAYTPANALPGEPLHILVRPEDKFDNLANAQPGPVEISVDGKPLPATVQPVEDSTCLRLTATLPEAGVYRISVRATDSGLTAETNPVVCSNDKEPVFWGMIHGHTEMSDGRGRLDEYFHQLKNEVALDFAATADHDHRYETSDQFWATACEAVRKWNQPGVFPVMLGYEWAKWRQNGDGDRNVYFAEDDRPMYRSDDGEYPAPPDLFKTLSENKEKAIVIPHHTGHFGNFCDWKDHNPEYERLVEIFQIRGSYECAAEDGNPLPERAYKEKPFPTGYIRNALAMGWRVGFTAGGDDHAGKWGTEAVFNYYKQGLMSVEAREKTRESVFQAMYNRRVTATSGPRMLLSYTLNGRPMGSELKLEDIEELRSVRRLAIEFHGTAPVASIDIIRNNSVVFSKPGEGGKDMEIVWEDTEKLDKIMMPPALYCDKPFTFYYVRVIQEDNEVAWASPVWMD